MKKLALVFIGSVVLSMIGCATPSSDAPKGAFASAPFDTPPEIVKRVNPLYPYDLRQKNISGWVNVQFVVNTDGSVSDAKAVASSNAGFEPAAIAAIEQDEFAPVLKNGQPVRVILRIKLDFAVDSDIPNFKD